MGWGELIKQGLKSSTKAMVKRGSTVITDKIPDGVVQKVNPYSKKVTVQSKDGKMRETIKSSGVRVKPIKTRTREESIHIADEGYAPKKIDELTENELSAMSNGEIRQRLIDSDLNSYSDLAKAAPGNSDVMRRVRNIGQDKVPGLRKTAGERGNIAEAKAQAKQESDTKKLTEELKTKKTTEIKRKQTETEKRHSRQPKASDPELVGDTMALISASQRFKDTGKWKKGGSVNVKKKKKYREVTNRFSDRMLPNKKRTTRIY